MVLWPLDAATRAQGPNGSFQNNIATTKLFVFVFFNLVFSYLAIQYTTTQFLKMFFSLLVHMQSDKTRVRIMFCGRKKNQYSLHKPVLFNYVDRRIVFTSSITIINPHKKKKTKKIDDHEENNKIISTIPSFSNSVLHSLIIMVNVTVMVHNVCAWCISAWYRCAYPGWQTPDHLNWRIVFCSQQLVTKQLFSYNHKDY